MRPKKYPYSGAKKANKTTKKEKLELVAFPNIAIKVNLSYEETMKILNLEVE